MSSPATASFVFFELITRELLSSYALLMNTYSKYEPITLSSNVCEKTVAAIKESSVDLPTASFVFFELITRELLSISSVSEPFVPLSMNT